MTPRQRLLDAAVEHVAENGISDLSLRELAAALGTSHRMLIHHFGSKQELWIAIVQTMEARQRTVMRELLPVSDQPIETAMREWWARISAPELWPYARLFYEIYGQALQDRAPTKDFLAHVIDDWLDPITQINLALGADPADARDLARLGIATTRGLLLDLLTTADRDAADAAMHAFITMYAERISRHAR